MKYLNILKIKKLFFSKSRSEKYSNKVIEKFNLKDYQGAIKDFSKAINLNRKNEDAFTKRGIVKFFLKDNQGAIDDYSEALKLNPKNSEARDLRNNIYQRFRIQDIFYAWDLDALVQKDILLAPDPVHSSAKNSFCDFFSLIFDFLLKILK